MDTTPSGAADVDVIARPDELRVTRIRALRGPNFWRLAPVIACDVTLGALEDMSSADLPGFTERLTSLLPTLHEHECTRGAPGGFVQRLREGTLIPHILEHVALELQARAGTNVAFGRVVASGAGGEGGCAVEREELEGIAVHTVSRRRIGRQPGGLEVGVAAGMHAGLGAERVTVLVIVILWIILGRED